MVVYNYQRYGGSNIYYNKIWECSCYQSVLIYGGFGNGLLIIEFLEMKQMGLLKCCLID